MNWRDVVVPAWAMVIILFIWGMMMLHRAGGIRTSDAGRRWRSIPRFYLALYYASVQWLPDVIGTDISHIMGRAGIVMIALADIIWLFAEWRMQCKKAARNGQ